MAKSPAHSRLCSYVHMVTWHLGVLCLQLKMPINSSGLKGLRINYSPVGSTEEEMGDTLVF